MGLNCVFVSFAKSRAVISPKSVTDRAASFKMGGIVMIGVSGKVIFEVIIMPVRMLPQARRLIGRRIVGEFSLMGDSELNRGWPMVTKKMIRML